MGSDPYMDDQRRANRTRDKMAWAQLGVGFLQGLQQSMAQSRQERLAQQQQDFQNNLATQRVGLERQGLQLHEQAQNDTRDWRRTQIAREQDQDAFTRQYQTDSLDLQGQHYAAQNEIARNRLMQDQAELQQRGAAQMTQERARRETQDVDFQKLGLEYMKQGFAPPQRQAQPQGPDPTAFNRQGYAQAMGGSLPGMPTMPAPPEGAPPEQSSAWQAGPGMQPELRHMISGIRPKPSHEEGERKRLDQGQVVGDFLRDTLQSGVVPDLKGGRLMIDKQPVTAQQLLDNPALAHRIAYELNGSEEAKADPMATIINFGGETNPKSPLGRMGLRPAEFGAMLAQGASMARQDPESFAAIARIDQRRMPPRAKDLAPASSRGAVGGGMPQVDNAEMLTPGHGAPRDVPRERQFGSGSPDQVPASQPAMAPASQPAPTDGIGQIEELARRIEAGDPGAMMTANEFGFLPDAAVPPQAWAWSGKEPPMAVKAQHQQQMQQHVDTMGQARRGGMQFAEERGKQVRGPGQPGTGGRLTDQDLARRQASEGVQRGQEARQHVPTGNVVRRDGQGSPMRQGVEQRIQLLQQQIARARTPQEAHPLRKQLAELQAILQNMGPTR